MQKNFLLTLLGFALSTSGVGAASRQTLAYGPNERDSLDLYLPETGDKPLLVYIHGGAWISGSKDSYRGLGKHLAAIGFPTAIVNYRLSGAGPRVHFPEHARDVARAIAFLHEHAAKLGLGPRGIFVVGHSAGAHIAATLALSPQFTASAQLLSGFVGIEGIYDIPALVRRWPTYRDWFINLAFGADESQWKNASPQFWRPRFPHPWLIFHSLKDELVDAKQSEAFYHHLRAVGVEAHLDLTSQQSHFGVIQALESAGNPELKRILDFVTAVKKK